MAAVDGSKQTSAGDDHASHCDAAPLRRDQCHFPIGMGIFAPYDNCILDHGMCCRSVHQT